MQKLIAVGAIGALAYLLMKKSGNNYTDFLGKGYAVDRNIDYTLDPDAVIPKDYDAKTGQYFSRVDHKAMSLQEQIREMVNFQQQTGSMVHFTPYGPKIEKDLDTKPVPITGLVGLPPPVQLTPQQIQDLYFKNARSAIL